MRIVFCGTPDYAVPSLKKLAARHEIVGVVSQPDRPKGRSKLPTPPPVVEQALSVGIPKERIFQPRSINQPDILQALRALQPDILCVVAYGKFLKKEALTLARHFPINAHASLLPRYRGAAPIQAALLNGDAESGVCIIKMEAGLDSGPVLWRKSIPIAPRETAGTLHDKLALLSAEAFESALDAIAANACTLQPQDDAAATIAPKLHKASGTINWTRDALALDRFVRAMTPWPGAWTTATSADGKFIQRLRIAEAALGSTSESMPAGAGGIEGSGTEQKLVAGCGDRRTLLISRVQPEGKREMSVAEFLRGAGKALPPIFTWK